MGNAQTVNGTTTTGGAGAGGAGERNSAAAGAPYGGPYAGASSASQQQQYGGLVVDTNNQQQQQIPPPPPQQQYHQQHPNSAASQQQQHQSNLQRSASDTSMTIMDNSTGGVVGVDGVTGAATTGMMEDWLDDDTVPTVFRWEHGGRNVYITGTFNGWSRQIPMHRSGNDFTYIHSLKRGKHAFKFIVDDEWRFAPDQPTCADIEGRINNFIDVTSFKPYTGDKDFEKEKAAAEYGLLETTPTQDEGEGEGGEGGAVVTSAETATTTTPGSTTTTTTAGAAGTTGTAAAAAATTAATDPNAPDRDGEVFSHNMPDVYDYTKEPPPLPPHLRHIILNKPPQLQDTAALPVPQHVALNHLYCTAIRDNMMVLGITQRYKTKFVTTVYYSPCSSNK